MQIIPIVVVALISTGILLAVGVQIFESFNDTQDCNSMSGSDGTAGHADTDKGWANTCYELQEQIQSGYALLIVTIIVLAAVGVLAVVKLL